MVLESHVENGLGDVRVAIVGAGFGGIGTAIRLRGAGYEDVVILERDDGLGGTWWANMYPGCACDVAAHLYSFSFALNPDWSRRAAFSLRRPRSSSTCGRSRAIVASSR